MLMLFIRNINLLSVLDLFYCLLTIAITFCAFVVTQWFCEEREKPTRCKNQMFIINFCLNMFQATLCPSSGEQRPCYYIQCVVLVLLDVVSSGCGALFCRMRALLASYNAAPHNRYQPHPAEPAQYTVCSNTRSLIS